MNEDGHVLKSRRGLLAAGLAVAVVGALGVASTMNAGAEQVSGDQGAAKAPVADQADAPAVSTPPAKLPWGDKPQRVRRGRDGASSRSLKAQGLQAASDHNAHTLDFAPKGRSTRTSVLRSEKTDVQPPAPAASPSTTTTTTAPDDSTTSPTTSSTTSPAADPTTAAATTSPASPSTSAAGVAPLAASSTPNAVSSTTPPVTGNNGAASKSVNFLYSVASQEQKADGLYASVDIKKPTLAKGEYHTLAELAVQTDDGSQTVEVGWNVDRSVNGDDDPHLFVFHWINGEPTCYNACGFQQFDGGAKPGDTLPVDTLKKFGIEHVNNAWWIAYDTNWVGNFPDKLWNEQGVDDFTYGSYFQAFGEVAAPTSTPCSQMGSGVKVGDPSGAAARMGNLTYINGPTVNMYMRSTNLVYGMSSIKNSTRSFMYGGPGASDPEKSSTDTVKPAC